MSDLETLCTQLQETVNPETWYHVLRHLYSPEANIESFSGSTGKYSHGVYCLGFDAECAQLEALPDVKVQALLTQARNTPGMADFLIQGDGNVPAVVSSLALLQRELNSNPDFEAGVLQARNQLREFDVDADVATEHGAAEMRKGLVAAMYRYFHKKYPTMSAELKSVLPHSVSLYTEIPERFNLSPSVLKFAPNLPAQPVQLEKISTLKLNRAEENILHANRVLDESMHVIAKAAFGTPIEGDLSELLDDGSAAEALRKYNLKRTSLDHPEELL